MRALSFLMLVATCFLPITHLSATTVNWLSGGPNTGYPSGAGHVDGDITLDAEYNTPCGLVMDSSGNYLFVADRENNQIRELDFGLNYAFDWVPQDINGNPLTNIFSKPVGLALDAAGNMYVLNRANNTNGTVLKISYAGITTNLSKITNAAGIALDYSGNIFVTASNQVFKVTPAGGSNVVATIPGAVLQGIVVKHNGLLAVCDSAQNGIYLINPNTGLVTTNAGFHGAGDFYYANNVATSNSAKFFQPAGIAEAGDGTLIVADQGNHRVKAVLASGVVTNIYGVTSNDWATPYPGFQDGTVVLPDKYGGVAARLPNGVTIAHDGTVYVTEDYYHIIRKVTGTGLQPPLPFPPSQPLNLIATASYGQVTLAWNLVNTATNYNIKRSTSIVGPFSSNIIGNSSTNGYTDTNVIDGTTYYYVVSGLNAGGEGPDSAVAGATPLFSPAPIFISITTNYGLISLTWSSSPGAIGYNLQRSPNSSGPYTLISSGNNNSYADTNVLNGNTYYYVVSTINYGGTGTNSIVASATVPLPPVPDPQIGYIDYPATTSPQYTSVFHPVSSAGSTFNNDVSVVIIGATGSQTFYNLGATISANSPTNGIADPTSGSSSAPSGYQDGKSQAEVINNYTIAGIAPYTILPDMTIRAIGEQSGHPNSSIVQSRFQFVTGNPNVIGNNAAQFFISDITANCDLYYTIDGSTPSKTNANAVHLAPVASTTNLWTIGFQALSNTTFKVVAVRNNYQDSAVVSSTFSPSNFVASTISFGFAAGEASSDFIASPGQTFYAPVTLTVLPNTSIYSLQFNLSVTNAGPNPGPAVAAGAYNFNSFLEEPIPNTSPPIYEIIPPLMYFSYATNPPPANSILNFYGPNGYLNFVNLATTNTTLNLLSVGWLERLGSKNLYDTTKQTLITYSQAHDVMYSGSGGQVEVGGYSFQVPLTATNGQTYQIQIGRPSATSDGIGSPGSDVFIAAPTNGATTGSSPINALKYVTVGQRKYIAGSVYPFRWFNAGDFGSSNIVNADVSQVFQAAVYELNSPPPGSDFFDAMDSCGATYVDLGHGYLEFNSYISGSSALNPLFDGNDSSIDQIAFGDGVLDICDVYVTFRRSLDPSLKYFSRFWNNGQRVATIAPNVANHLHSKVTANIVQPKILSNSTVSPQVNFAAGDIQGTSGQTVTIPITATIFGNYPLRVLLFNLTVEPLDGSPTLTTPVQFTQSAAVLGTPAITASTGNGNYSAVWLNSTNAGLTGTVTIGTLTVTIPSGASSNAAYAIHFDHASGSPNGIASFPKQVLTGLITLASRTNSSYGDGIPDSWRLRWFGTTNNYLSQSNACPAGDGINSWKKFVAGVDPNTANDLPSIRSKTVPSGSTSAIHWPSVSGKQYVIERSGSLFSGSWSAITTNTGTGSDMEFDDNSTNTVKFYRVRILP